MSTPTTTALSEADDECEHHDMDGYYCLDCGVDRAEHLMSQAYDMAKAARQDRED